MESSSCLNEYKYSISVHIVFQIIGDISMFGVSKFVLSRILYFLIRSFVIQKILYLKLSNTGGTYDGFIKRRHSEK